MSGRPVSAIVLAGGRSSRFGRDKLAEPVDGRPLLQHAIDAVRPFARETVVVLGTQSSPDVPPDVRVVRDPSPFQGPLVGLSAGIAAAVEPVVLVTAGDMPELVPPVIETLLAALDDPAVDAAVLCHDGRPRPLPMALRRVPAQAAASRLVGDGERRLRALPEALATTVIDEAVWRVHDPDGRTMRDVDTPGDLR
ncbi:MAG TPA: molybdenum cofactor guanylyltransferase [Candidatus Limnocylindrales bacterium]|nr:molybdenum cofactor guanylyltransferase [Candidatus Limnocylindrales bacterium]